MGYRPNADCLDIGLNTRALFAESKLAAKLFVVMPLTANGIALHALAFPILLRRRACERANPSMLVVLGAISTASWLYALFIGVSRSIAPAMSFATYMAFYGALLIAAVIVALLFVRPRMEHLLLVRDRV